jgi:hypothetical protein
MCERRAAVNAGCELVHSLEGEFGQRIWPQGGCFPILFFWSAPHVCWFPRPCSCSSKFSLFILSGPPCELFQETTVCRFFIDAHEAAAGQAGIFVLWQTAPGRKRGRRYRCQQELLLLTLLWWVLLGLCLVLVNFLEKIWRLSSSTCVDILWRSCVRRGFWSDARGLGCSGYLILFTGKLPWGIIHKLILWSVGVEHTPSWIRSSNALLISPLLYSSALLYIVFCSTLYFIVTWSVENIDASYKCSHFNIKLFSFLFHCRG